MPKVTQARLTKRTVEGAAPGSYAWDSEVRGFGVRVTVKGTRSFVYRYKVPAPTEADPDNKRQVYEPIGGFPTLTVEQAREKAKALAAQPRTDHREAREKAADERLRAKTVGDLGEHYLGEYAKGRALRASTVKAARCVLELIPDTIRDKRVDEVTKPDMRRVHGDAKEAAGIYQANRLLAVLSKMFSLAEEEGWRSEANPCRGVKKYEENQRWRNLSEPEVARLLDACDAYSGAILTGVDIEERPGFMATHPDLLGERENSANAVRLLLYTGARLREVLRAEWEQFDLERGRWTKPSSHTKTKRQHFLELDGPALDLLRAMRERDPAGRFLFPGKPLEVSPGRFEARARADLKRPWKWIAREAGFEGVRLHDLRRTTASFMLSGGASLATVGSALGHTQAATTQRYAHLSHTVQRRELKDAGERMAALRGTSKKPGVSASTTDERY